MFMIESAINGNGWEIIVQLMIEPIEKHLYRQNQLFPIEKPDFEQTQFRNSWLSFCLEMPAALWIGKRPILGYVVFIGTLINHV